MKSMTGFSEVTKNNKKCQIYIRIKSLNSRFLDLKLQIPNDYLDLESKLRLLIQEKVKRANIEVIIQRKEKEDLSSFVDEKIFTSLSKKLKSLATKNQLSPPQFSDVLKITTTHKVDSKDIATSEKKAVVSSLKEALEKLDSEKTREGKALKKDLLNLLNLISKDRDKIESMRDLVVEELKDRFEKKVKNLEAKVHMDPFRMQQELVFLIDRSDIFEELSRLKEHIRAFKGLMSPPVEGKKLDFYSQELLRETNTIGAKSQLSEITALVVNMKNNIERIRELSQNVE